MDKKPANLEKNGQKRMNSAKNAGSLKTGGGTYFRVGGPGFLPSFL
jgi:hypothetical protein